MTLYDLRTQDLTIDELFRLAADTSIHVIAKDGHTFVIEPADAFAQEVAMLGQSDAFMRFLAERSKQKQGSISLDELEHEIDNDSTN
jgi:hypothetical protein